MMLGQTSVVFCGVKSGTDLVFRPNEVCPCLYDLYELGTDLDVFEVSPYLNYSIFFDNMSYEFSQKPNKDLFQLLQTAP